MEVGTLLHWALAHWLQGRDPQEILAHFDQAWQDTAGETLPRQERLHPANVKLCLQHWMAQQPRRDVHVCATEQTFEVPLGRINGEEIMYYGTPDALLEWKSDLYVLDHKSTGDIDEDWAAQWSMNSGLQGYVWGLRQRGYPIKGAFVNGIEIRRLPPWDGNLEKKCQTHKVKYKECQPIHVKGEWVGPLWWSDARLECWRKDVLSMTRRLMDLREADLDTVKMDGQWRWPGCSGGRGRAPCQYRSFCQAGRPTEGLTHMMIPVPWRRESVSEEEEG